MTYMELIQIITTVLILGSGLLLVVVVVSFLLSKVKEEDNSEQPRNVNFHNKPDYAHLSANREQLTMRNKQSMPVPKIFQLDQFKPQEVKTIRKKSSADRLSDEKHYAKEIAKTKSKSSRYTIINDQIKNVSRSHKAMNFYF